MLMCICIVMLKLLSFFFIINNHESRWNRVKILEEALHADDGWLNTVEYVVWMVSSLNTFHSFNLNALIN